MTPAAAMGLLERVEAAREEQRTIGGVPWRPWDSPYVPFSAGGPANPSRSGAGGVDAALRLQPVYSSVRLLAEGVAQLPLQQYRDLGGRKAKMPPGQLVAKPSAFLNTFNWLYQYVSSAALQGIAAGLITARDGYGYPTTAEWLPAEHVEIVDSSPWNPAQARFYYYGRQVPREDLIYVPAFTIPGRTRGISPMRYFQLLIESGNDALEYGASWYRAGGFPPGTFQNSETEVEPEQAAEIRARLTASIRSRQPLVYGRDWDYKPVTVPPSEAQFIEAMQLNATQVAAVYGVPPHRVGGTRGDSMTYSNVESEAIGFITDTLDPWLVRLEAALAECLPSSQYVQFNRNARLRTTAEARFGVYRAARDIGIMNVDEIRKLEDMEPLPTARGRDDYDGTDYTPLQIMVAAARGLKEELGTTEGVPQPGLVPVGPDGKPVAAKPGAPVPASANGKAPAMNGNGHG